MKIKNFFKKHKRKILLGTGVTCCVGGAVIGVINGAKLKGVNEKNKNDILKLDDKSTKKDKFKTYMLCAWRYVKLFGPVVGLEALGTCSFIGMYGDFDKELAGKAAALAALSTDFKEYRQRVKDRFGEDIEDQIYNNYTVEEVAVEEKDEETGKKKKVKKQKKVYGDPANRSFFFEREVNDPNHKDGHYINMLVADNGYTDLNHIENIQQSLRRKLLERSYKLKDPTNAYIDLNETREEYGLIPIPDGADWRIYYNPDININQLINFNPASDSLEYHEASDPDCTAYYDTHLLINMSSFKNVHIKD